MNGISLRSQPDALHIPLGRASIEDVRTAREKVLLEGLISALLEAMPVYVLVLNRERQVLAVNRRLLAAFGIENAEALVGKRPGEALNCIHSAKGAGGCGSALQCSKCGAVLAIVESQIQGASARRECRITLDGEAGACLDLEVLATPVDVAGMRLTVFAMRDVSAEKRRSVLERVFFHDLINTAGGIRGLAELLARGHFSDPAQESEYRVWMAELAERLVDEIVQQRSLLAAERGEFQANPGVVDVQELLAEVHRLYANHDIAEGRQLVIVQLPEVRIVSDAMILRRILGNMVKNALEATPRGGTVTIYGKEAAEAVTFCVNNPGVMPEDVQLQLFQRSFSTKAAEGRGIGTYSIKLFGERYLKGKVGFVSVEPDGTTFCLTIPRQL